MSTQTRKSSLERRHYSPSASVSISGDRLVPLLVLVAILCGIAIGLTAFAFAAARNADREARMLEYYVLELDAKFINAGLKDPSEAIAKRLKEQREDR